MIKKNIFTLFFLLLIVIGYFSSCSFIRPLPGQKLHIEVTISEKANQNSPIAVDLIFVFNDEKLLDNLLKMSSREWFEKREQIKLDYYQTGNLEYWGWEWAPGQKIPVQVLPLKRKIKGCIIFAKYLSSGDHRSRIDPLKDISIHFHENSFSVTAHD